MDIVFGQLHLLMLGTELEAVPADTVSFELCISSYLRASCVHSDRVCGLYLFIINVLLLFECHWSHSLQILLDVRNNNKPSNLNLSLVSEQHNYATRSASLQHLNPESFRINIRKFCPTILGCSYWNDIPPSICNQPTGKLFKSKEACDVRSANELK